MLVLAAVVVTGVWWSRLGRTPQATAVEVAGGDGGRLPRNDPGAEGFDPAALQSALAQEPGARALLVMRHEHLVYEAYGTATDANTLLDGGGFAAALAALAAGVAVTQDGLSLAVLTPFDPPAVAGAVASASHMTYAQFLSRNVWQPLNAAPARLLAPRPGVSSSTGSALSARAIDWLRVAGLLLHDGRFEGTQVVPSGWVARMLPRREGGSEQMGWGLYPGSAAGGAEPFASDGVYYLRGPGATRLWLVPRLDLAILRATAGGDGADGADGVDGGAAGDETRLPNRVIRAVRDRPQSGGVSLRDLVPGH